MNASGRPIPLWREAWYNLCRNHRQARGRHIGESLFEYVKQQAKELGCYEVTLNVWEGNTPAEHFYERMGMKTKERQMEYILFDSTN